MTREFFFKLVFSAAAVVALTRFIGFREPLSSDISDNELFQKLSSLHPPTSIEIDLERAELGKKFFFDRSFSHSQSISCSSCHASENSFAAPTSFDAVSPPRRDVPTLIDSAESSWLYWDGRADSLEQQLFGPLFDKNEHGVDWQFILETLQNRYPVDVERLSKWGKGLRISKVDKAPQPFTDFLLAFILTTLDTSHQVSIIAEADRKNLTPVGLLREKWMATNSVDLHPQTATQLLGFANALAEFERTIRATNSPFERFLARLKQHQQVQRSFSADFGETQWKGAKVFFGKGNCHLCHQGSSFTDRSFHNIGLESRDLILPDDLGRSYGARIYKNSDLPCLQSTSSCKESEFLNLELTNNVGAFKTPTLKNLLHTAPYFHDGSRKTLDDVINHYSDLSDTVNVGEREETLKKLNLSKEEKYSLRKFLESLSGDVVFFGSASRD